MEAEGRLLTFDVGASTSFACRYNRLAVVALTAMDSQRLRYSTRSPAPVQLLCADLFWFHYAGELGERAGRLSALYAMLHSAGVSLHAADAYFQRHGVSDPAALSYQAVMAHVKSCESEL